MTEFLLTFRETLEAVLIVGILYTFLHKTGHHQAKRPLWLGVGAAIGASVLVGLGIEGISASLGDAHFQTLFEAIMMYLAAGFLIWMIVWMARRRNISQDLKDQAQTALKTSVWAIFGVAFVAVLREGFETAIFLFASDRLGGGLSWLGALSGIAIAAAAGFLLFAQGRRLPIKTFFNVTSVFLIFVAAGMTAYGTHELEEYVVERRAEQIQAAAAQPDSNTSLKAGADIGLPASLNPANWYTEAHVARPFQLFEEHSEVPEGASSWAYTQSEGHYYHFLHEKGSVGRFFKAFLGYNSNPNWLEFTLWLVMVGGGFYFWLRR
jgi:high-affinity iron transporter